MIKEKFLELLKKYKINLKNSEINKLLELVNIFYETNKNINLSAIRDKDWILEKHIIDALKPLEFIDFEKWIKVLDLWTWWWMPGLPLAIVNPQSFFTLLDARQKKIKVLEEFNKTLNLKNVNLQWGRAEELSKNKEYKKQFDIVISRWVAYMPKILEWSKPFLKKWALIYLWKQASYEEFDEWLKRAYDLDIDILSEHIYTIWKQEDSLSKNNPDRSIFVFKNKK